MFKDQDKDQTPKDKDKDQTFKDNDQDKDCILVLKESLRTRTRTNITVPMQTSSLISTNNTINSIMVQFRAYWPSLYKH